MWLIEAIFSKEFSMCVRIRNVYRIYYHNNHNDHKSASQIPTGQGCVW